MEEEKTFLQILSQLPDVTGNITKIDSEFMTIFCNALCSEKSIRGVLKIEDVTNKFEQSLDMIDELLRIDSMYATLGTTLSRVESNIELNYFEFMSTMLSVDEEVANEDGK